MRAVVPAQWGEDFWNQNKGNQEELARMGISEVTVLFPDSAPDCADFTADEPFLLLWGDILPGELSAAAQFHRERCGAATLLLRPCGAKGGWQVSCDRRGRVNYLEETPPVPRCEEVFSCAGGAICEPMPGLPLPECEEDLLTLLRFWMDRGELWGATAGERPESRAAMGEEVTENPLYFL